MSEYDKSWLKWVALGAIIGYAVGEILSFLLSLTGVQSESFELLRGLLAPAGTIAGLLVVLYVYSRKRGE